MTQPTGRQAYQERVNKAFGKAAIYDALKPRYDTLLEAAKAAWEVIHHLHSQQYHMSVGKGICEWKPCADLRKAIALGEPKGEA